MTSSTGGASGNAPINWQPATTEASGEEPRTTRSAKFNAGGKEYTVTVSYNRQAVMDKYGVGDENVDATIEEMISKIGSEQLKNLAGRSISTSLRDSKEQIQYKKNTESTYKIFSKALKNTDRPLYDTISSVRSVFFKNAQSLKSIPKSTGEPPSSDEEDLRLNEFFEESSDISEDNKVVSLSVDEELSSPTTKVRFNPVEDSTEVSPKEVGFRNLTGVFSENLSGANPLKGDRPKLNKIILANEYTKDGEVEFEDDSEYLEHKNTVVEVLRGIEMPVESSVSKSEMQNDVLKQLENVEFADEIRVELGLQNEHDVFLDISQGQVKIEGQPPGVGKSACASICGEAILRMVNKEVFISDRETLLSVIEDGIRRHVGEEKVDKAPIGRHFDKVFEDIKKEVDSELEVELNLADLSFEAHIELDVGNMKETDYIVFTAEGRHGGSEKETILVFKDDRESKWAVFDSHGTQEKGADRGASVRWFDSSDEAVFYLSEHLKIDSDEKEIFKISEAEIL